MSEALAKLFVTAPPGVGHPNEASSHPCVDRNATVEQSDISPGCLERWLPVVNYEGWYEVSDLGRVRRIRGKDGKILKPIYYEGGYCRVHLCREGVRRKWAVHILVARAFIGPCPDGCLTCHGPGGVLDNRLVNLSYGTPAKNNGEDRWRDGTIQAGAACSKAKLTDDAALEIRERAASGEVATVLALEFGVEAKAIRKLAQGLTWKSAGGPLTERHGRRGERQWQARLTEAAVRDIRTRHAEGSASAAELAREYGVGDTTVRQVISRHTWKHVA